MSHSDIHKLEIPEYALIPFMTSADGAPFEIQTTENYLVDHKKLSVEKKRNLKAEGIKLFDRNSTQKIEPILIQPRGIGRHFCAINSAKAFSASGVDVYDSRPNSSENVILNLWLFLNSSIAWLIREVSGRKNLGGGMLKAEAVDLKSFPIFFDFENIEEIRNIKNKLNKRQALDTLAEIDTPEHCQIDDLVFSFLEIDKRIRTTLVELLKTKIIERTTKSKT